MTWVTNLITMTMDTKPTVETIKCQHMPGYMALVWQSGTLYQVFSRRTRLDVQQDADAYTYMLRRGLL